MGSEIYTVVPWAFDPRFAHSFSPGQVRNRFGFLLGAWGVCGVEAGEMHKPQSRPREIGGEEMEFLFLPLCLSTAERGTHDDSIFRPACEVPWEITKPSTWYTDGVCLLNQESPPSPPMYARSDDSSERRRKRERMGTIPYEADCIVPLFPHRRLTNPLASLPWAHEQTSMMKQGFWVVEEKEKKNERTRWNRAFVVALQRIYHTMYCI